MTPDTLQAENAELKRKLAEAEKARHPDHSHCITPCDSIRIQEENHSAYLLMKDRAEAAERKCAELSEALVAVKTELESFRKCLKDGPTAAGHGDEEPYCEEGTCFRIGEVLADLLKQVYAALAAQPALEGKAHCHVCCDGSDPKHITCASAPSPDCRNHDDPKPEMSAEVTSKLAFAETHKCIMGPPCDKCAALEVLAAEVRRLHKLTTPEGKPDAKCRNCASRTYDFNAHNWKCPVCGSLEPKPTPEVP
jgi:hypothetical protein